MIYRIPHITQRIKGKTVLHYGCADGDIFREKIANKTFLHDYVVEHAFLYAGIDTYAHAVEELTEMGYKYLYTKETAFTEQYRWDYILLGEIIEHVDNPTAFLKEIKYHHPLSDIIITTPNAFALKNFLKALRGKESVNLDHRCWFSGKTLSGTLSRAGYHGGKIMFIESYKRGFLHRMFLNIFPHLRNTLYYESNMAGH